MGGITPYSDTTTLAPSPMIYFLCNVLISLYIQYEGTAHAPYVNEFILDSCCAIIA